MRFANAEKRAAFARELTEAVARLAAKYHDERAPGGRRFRLLAAVHPTTTEGASMEKTLPLTSAAPSRWRSTSPRRRDEVWRALTQAEELVRWFPMEARVTPGVGGTMLWNWGEGQDWESRIDVWEPGRRLRLVAGRCPALRHPGPALAAGMSEPARIAMEFTLETHRGKTRLRLVHSGFGEGAAWDTEIEGISEGWQAELRSLRHYLERHRGRTAIRGARCSAPRCLERPHGIGCSARTGSW